MQSRNLQIQRDYVVDGIICVPLSEQQLLDLDYNGPDRCGPWEIDFDGCTFSGNLTDSADVSPSPLVRTGDCASSSGYLELSSKGITSVPEDVFANMEGVR